jgi:hypothetical protein
LFATLHTAVVTEQETNIVIQAKPFPKLKLDMDYLVNIYHDLCTDEKLIQKLNYYPNTSLYKVSAKWRHHEYRSINNRTVFHLVHIDDNAVLSKLVKKTASGISYAECVNTIVAFGFDKTEAKQYLTELIQSQVLVSELYPNVSGADYQTVLFEKLSKFEKYQNLPNTINIILQSSETILTKTAQIKGVLTNYFTTTINDNKFIQVDTLRNAIESNLNVKVPLQILEAAELINKLTSFDKSQTTLTKLNVLFMNVMRKPKCLC